jgi:hypothetical protein
LPARQGIDTGRGLVEDEKIRIVNGGVERLHLHGIPAQISA